MGRGGVAPPGGWRSGVGAGVGAGLPAPRRITSAHPRPIACGAQTGRLRVGVVQGWHKRRSTKTSFWMFALCTLAFLSAGSVYAQSVTGKAVEVCATTALRQLEKRLAGRKITLDIDPAAKAWLAGEGYDPVYGARPLKRVIQRSLQDPLAEMILSGDVMDGETVTVSAGADGLIIGDRVAPTRRERPMDAVVH